MTNIIRYQNAFFYLFLDYASNLNNVMKLPVVINVQLKPFDYFGRSLSDFFYGTRGYCAQCINRVFSFSSCKKSRLEVIAL